MNERRKGKRVPFNSKISVSSLYRSGEQQLIELKDIEILVTNISSTGVGFQSKINLPVDYFFNCRLDIPTSASIYCVVKIVRSEKLSDSKIYDIGCEIVGLSSICSDIINSYVNNC
ncbi:MAG: PilZ domain-containing protein [Bacillota bacterium]|nr:PilZ domain-containing protein [Bacillota bacterium]